MRLLTTLTSALVFSAGAAVAQTSTTPPAASQAVTAAPAQTPPADPADVASVDAILAALYDVISGPPGERDWDRFRSLFTPAATKGGVFRTPDGRIVARGMTPERYIQVNAPQFAQTGFFESEIGRKETRTGPLVHVLSAYAARRAAEDAEPFMRGVNAIQLLDDGQRVWIASIVWAQETPENPIPADLLAPR